MDHQRLAASRAPRGCARGSARAAIPCRRRCGRARPAGSSRARSRRSPPPAAARPARAGPRRVGSRTSSLSGCTPTLRPEVVVRRGPARAPPRTPPAWCRCTARGRPAPRPSPRGSRGRRPASSGKLRWQWESTNMAAKVRAARRRRQRRRAQMVWVGLGGRDEVPRISSILSLSSATSRRPGSARRRPGCGWPQRVGRRDPGHLAGHRVALRVVGQRQQHVDVVAQLVVARGRHEHAAVGEQRDVGRVQRGLLLDGELDDARARRCRAGALTRSRGASGGRSWREFSDGSVPRLQRRGAALRALLTSASSIRPALNGCSAVAATRASSRHQAVSAAQRRGRRQVAPAGKKRGARAAGARPAASWQSFCSASTARGRASRGSGRRVARATSAGQARPGRPRRGRARRSASASCGRPPAARQQHRRRSRHALLAPARPAACGVGGSGQGVAWQRLRMVGSSWCGRSLASTKRASPGGSSSVFSKALAVTGSCARPDGPAPPCRARAPLVRARTRSRRASPRRGSPCWACASCRRCPPAPSRCQRPAQRSRSVSGISTSRSGCERACDRWQLRAARRRRRAARSAASHSQACASASASSNWPSPAGPVTAAQRMAALRRSGSRSLRSASQGSRRASARYQPRASQRRLRPAPHTASRGWRASMRTKRSGVGCARGRVAGAHPLEEGERPAPRTGRARARRRRGAPRRTAGQVEPQRQVAAAGPCLHPALRAAPAPAGRSRGRRPGRRRWRR